MRAVMAVVALAAATACSIPEKQLTVNDPFGCLGDPLPTTAATRVTIAGTLADPFNGTVVGNAAVEVFLVGTPSPIVTTTSDAGGKFSQDQGTGGAPRNAFLRVSPNGYLPTYYYPAVPITRDVQTEIQLLTAAGLGTIAMVSGVTLDPSKANFLVTVTDCNGRPLAGATVTTNPAGTVRYFAEATPSPTAVATDAMTGSALVANVPISNTTVSAMVSGMTLRSHTLDSVAGAIMQTEIQP